MVSHTVGLIPATKESGVVGKSVLVLDTFSCMVQGLIPYGVQMLLAAGLANLSPMDILPYLYYPLAIGVAALLAILLRYPKRYS